MYTMKAQRIYACRCHDTTRRTDEFEVAYARMLRRERRRSLLIGAGVVAVMLLSCALPLAYIALR